MRFFAFILFYLSILYLPFWFSFFLCVALAFTFDQYFEAIFMGFAGDALYSPFGSYNILLSFGYLIIFSLIVVLVEFLKKRLKFYEESV